MIQRVLTLWDSPTDHSEHTEWIYTWNGYEETGSTRSLLRYVEEHGEKLRSKYLAWVHDLGESRVKGKRLIDHLTLEDGLSYWWMTLFVEKSPYKSPITDAIRLLALEEIVTQHKPDKLRLVSSNPCLNEGLSGLCQCMGIAYEWKRLSNNSPRQLSLRRIYRALPNPVRALVTLIRYVWGRWSLRRADRKGWLGGNNSLFLCSYFVNLVPESAEAGNFRSIYWGGLHDLMGKLGLFGNWLQLYVPHNTMPSPQIALDSVEHFNRHEQGQSFHAFLDSYLSWRIVFRVLRKWFWLNGVSWRLGNMEKLFRPQGCHLSLWPLMRGDWYNSTRGNVAIDNLLWDELFDRALHSLPHQKKGLYLCENQAWERALIHNWRKHNHGQIIAVGHSTTRFWDLRNFTDSRTIRSSGSNQLPLADLIALNGKITVDAYLDMNYPKEAIAEIEALRFSYLSDLPVRHASKKTKRDTIKVLILGDATPQGTTRLLQLLCDTAPHIEAPITYTLKPHPSFPVKSTDYPSLRLKVITNPLREILCDFDIAYASNMTSASVDAYLAGLPVLVFLEESELNFSPLRGQPGACFVSSPGELAEALQNQYRDTVIDSGRKDFFFLNPELPRWKRLMGAGGLK